MPFAPSAANVGKVALVFFFIWACRPWTVKPFFLREWGFVRRDVRFFLCRQEETNQRRTVRHAFRSLRNYSLCGELETCLSGFGQSSSIFRRVNDSDLLRRPLTPANRRCHIHRMPVFAELVLGVERVRHLRCR